MNVHIIGFVLSKWCFCICSSTSAKKKKKRCATTARCLVIYALKLLLLHAVWILLRHSWMPREVVPRVSVFRISRYYLISIVAFIFIFALRFFTTHYRWHTVMYRTIVKLGALDFFTSGVRSLLDHHFFIVSCVVPLKCDMCIVFIALIIVACK